MRVCIRRLHASLRRNVTMKGRARKDRAFTLVEILVAMVVTLIMLGIVVTIFGMIGTNVSKSRSMMEKSDQLRACKHRLQLDLAGITVPMIAPQSPQSAVGYFEYTEGPVGRMPAFTINVADENGTMGPDTTVGDTDDWIAFTTQSANEPFVGRHFPSTTNIQSQVAEVIWFVRGTTLYRRQLLVKPDLNRTPGGMPTPTQLYTMPHINDSNLGQSYYAVSDVSVHADGKGPAGYANLGPLPDPSTVAPGTPSDPLRLVANSLSDLTKRENRYAHIPVMGNQSASGINNAPLFGWPFDARQYGWFVNTVTGQVSTGRLGLATLQECSDPLCPLPIGISNNPTGTPVPFSRFFPTNLLQLSKQAPATAAPFTPPTNDDEGFDAWDNPHPWNQGDLITGQLNSFNNGNRAGEDIILTNVLSFDVKVWDPTAPILLDADGTTVLLPGDPGPGYGLPTSAYGAALVAAVTTPARIIGHGAYVDLNYGFNVSGVPSTFSGPGDPRSGLTGPITFANGTYTVPNNLIPAVYDTYSTHYEHDGIDQGNYIGGGFVGTDEGTNGLDDNGNGLIDEDAEQETAPPYRAPIRGLQIKIRCFDPDSKQIREVTVIQEFLPE